jgi:hypothetical protein
LFAPSQYTSNLRMHNLLIFYIDNYLIVFYFTGIKRQNHQHWWTKLTFGTNGYVHQPMISLGYNFLNFQKKRKNLKDLTKS